MKEGRIPHVIKPKQTNYLLLHSLTVKTLRSWRWWTLFTAATATIYWRQIPTSIWAGVQLLRVGSPRKPWRWASMVSLGILSLLLLFHSVRRNVQDLWFWRGKKMRVRKLKLDQPRKLHEIIKGEKTTNWDSCHAWWWCQQEYKWQSPPLFHNDKIFSD